MIWLFDRAPGSNLLICDEAFVLANKLLQSLYSPYGPAFQNRKVTTDGFLPSEV
jgi:hypothetical protein